MRFNKKNVVSSENTKTYVTGFILSVILTIIPFWMVMSCSVSNLITICVIILTAVIQVIVHLIYFLHMNTNLNEIWNITAFIFTLIIITILVSGSIWIMWNLNCNMMVN